MSLSRRAASALILSTPALVWFRVDPAAALELLTRDGWSARPPTGNMPAHTPTRLTLHHTAVLQDPGRSLVRKLQSLQRFSQSDERLADGRRKAAWPDLPYHFYIDVNGVVAEGRNTDFAGDTNTAYDPSGHIGIVLEGNFEREGPTDAQIDACVALLVYLARKEGIAPEQIGTHRDYAQTACPGTNLRTEIEQIRDRVTQALSS